MTRTRRRVSVYFRSTPTSRSNKLVPASGDCRRGSRGSRNATVDVLVGYQQTALLAFTAKPGWFGSEVVSCVLASCANEPRARSSHGWRVHRAHRGIVASWHRGIVGLPWTVADGNHRVVLNVVYGRLHSPKNA